MSSRRRRLYYRKEDEQWSGFVENALLVHSLVQAIVRSLQRGAQLLEANGVWPRRDGVHVGEVVAQDHGRVGIGGGEHRLGTLHDGIQQDGATPGAGQAAGQLKDPGRMIVLLPIQRAYAMLPEITP